MAANREKYTHHDWNVQFSHDLGWEVEQSEAQKLRLFPEGESGGGYPGVQLTICETKEADLSALLADLIREREQATEALHILQQGVTTLKDSSKRAAVLFEFEIDNVRAIAQEVIIPIGSNRFLFFRALSEKSRWKDFQPEFSRIVRSVRPSHEQPQDVEIVFTGAPRSNGADQAELATRKLSALLSTPNDERLDDAWLRETVDCACRATYFITELPYLQDDFGYSYLSLFTEMPPDLKYVRRVSLKELTQEVTEGGAGVVIDPYRGDGASGMQFSFGALWGYREFGTFYTMEEANESARKEVSPNILRGKPSDSFLPPYVRAILKRLFVEGMEISHPSVFLETDPNQPVPYTLVFNLMDYTREEEDLNRYLDYLQWFVRPGVAVAASASQPETEQYSVALV